MVTKETIIEEIKALSVKLGRTPGKSVFEKETGIVSSEWYGKHWRSWGDAVLEAGLVPNKIQGKIDSDFVLESFAEATRHFNRIPAVVDLRMYAKSNKGFPAHNTFFSHFGNKSGLLEAFSTWLEGKPQFSDLVPLLPSADSIEENSSGNIEEGLVYLMKSGEFYKIGRSNEIEKRVKQIGTALPEKLTLLHTIRTDDPPGIEAYWHRRFSDKRANGEWFKLSRDDIRAFKRRKFQ